MAGSQAPRVLLIGQSIDEREMYGEALRLEGFCTLQADSADGASRMVSELRPSAVIVNDGRLDRGFGLEMVRELTGCADGASLPVLMLTSHARPADLDAARRAGCHQVIFKPCAPEVLIQHLGELMGVAGSSRHTS